MRPKFLAAAVLLVSTVTFGQSSISSSLSQIPEGQLSADTYTNDTLGVIFHFPRGWTVNLDAGHSVSFGKDPDGPANRCTRILLRYGSPRKVKGWFSAWGVLLAIDPACLAAGPFPTSAEQDDSAQINDFGGRIFQIYHPAPFFPPGGVDIFATRAVGGPVIVYLEGKGFRNVDEIDPTLKRTPVPVRTNFSITEAPKFWVAWAEIADDHSRTEMMKKSRLEVKTQ